MDKKTLIVFMILVFLTGFITVGIWDENGRPDPLRLLDLHESTPIWNAFAWFASGVLVIGILAFLYAVASIFSSPTGVSDDWYP